MKKTLLFFVLIFATPGIPPAAAQTTDFRVVVRSGQEPVGYAYVLINGNIYSMTDAEGTARIRASRLERGDTLSARFVGMESVQLVWDGSKPVGSTIELELMPNRIDAVVVTARRRDRSKQFFRKYVNKMPTHGWYIGFRGDYDVKLYGDRSWTARGKYQREHVPGDDVYSTGADTFTLRPEPGQDSALMWQIQRHLLTVKGIAERAVQLDGGDSNRGMITKYRGNVEGRNVFLIIKPYFDRFQGTDDSFQTLIHVNERNGIIYSSETISQTKYGIWNVSASYAAYSPTGRSFDSFIYPTRVKAKFEERSLLLDLDAVPVKIDVIIDNITVYHFAPGMTSQQGRKN